MLVLIQNTQFYASGSVIICTQQTTCVFHLFTKNVNTFDTL